jgi:hypothetical protein
MAYIVADRVKETTTVTGTGPATLAGAASGYRSFASQLSIGDTCAYVIVNSNASEWETGIGTYSAVNTLTRTTIQASTNANAAVVFTAGTKDVFMAPTANTILSDVTSTDGSVTINQTGTISDLSVAVSASTLSVLVVVRNTTGATLTKGTIVYINGSTGQLSTVAKAIANSDATSAQTLGMISADLANNSNGYVTIIGLISNINTSAYVDGDQLYLSGTTAGTFTKVKPHAPTHLVYVGIVEHAHVTQGKIFVKVQNGYELDELHDVSAQSPSNGQTIVYNSSNQLWEKNYPSLTNALSSVPVVSGAGNNLTLTAGSGVTSGAGGSLILQAGIQATTGGDGKVVVKQVVGQTSNLQEWQNSAGAVLASVSAAGNFSLTGTISIPYGGAGIVDASNNGSGANYGFYGPRLGSQATVAWNGGGPSSGAFDLFLARDAAGTLAQRNGTNAQAFRVYNTYTDASNYERLVMDWSTTANVGYIGFQRAGTGAQRNVIVDLGGNPTAGANRIQTISTNNVAMYSGNVNHIQFIGGTITFLGENAYGAGTTRTLGLGISAAGNANRNADKYVFRAIGFGTGNTIPTYVGFGAAYVQSGITSTQSHTQEDCFLVRLLASATPIVAFGDSFVSTVPAIKRVGTRLQARLADDSGYATWEGPLNSNAVSAIALPTAATVTAATGDGTTVTYTAANTFSVGQVVSITGLTTTTGSSLNLSNQTITTASATQFTITNATVGTAAATQSGTATIQSAGNSVTITAGNGSGVGAGGNIILQPGAQGSSGGNGVTVWRNSAGVEKARCLESGQFISSTAGVGYGWAPAGATSITHGLRCNNPGQGYITIQGQGNNFFSVDSNNGQTNVAAPASSANWRFQLVNSTNAETVNGAWALSCSTSDGVALVRNGASAVAGGGLAFPSSTTAFSANTNDLALTGSGFQRINCTSAASLTGIAPPSSGTHVDGRMVRIYNVGTANLTLAHNSASSTAANKFWNSTGADIVLSTHQYVELIYDSTDNGRGGAGWRVSSVH